MDGLVAQAADLVATLIQDKDEEQVALNPVDDRVRFALGRITGATGDGADALQRAMTVTLGQYGAIVTQDVTRAQYRLEARITLGPSQDGAQDIAIEWIVQDQQGAELGIIIQRNRLPTSQLQGTWGSMAFGIAQAALQGIGQMVEEHRRQRQSGIGR